MKDDKTDLERIGDWLVAISEYMANGNDRVAMLYLGKLMVMVSDLCEAEKQLAVRPAEPDHRQSTEVTCCGCGQVTHQSTITENVWGYSSEHGVWSCAACRTNSKQDEPAVKVDTRPWVCTHKNPTWHLYPNGHFEPAACGHPPIPGTPRVAAVLGGPESKEDACVECLTASGTMFGS